MQLRRRNLLALFLASPAWSLLQATGAAAQEAGARIDLTPSCGDDHPHTPSSDEGPFYRSDAPDRHQLVEQGASDEAITIAGLVMDTGCRPFEGALVEVWHADAQGDYDNSGERFRGVHRSDANGRWWFSTIVPALYPGRTRHYHFKVQPPGRSTLTTQLFFPGEARNAQDALFDERLLLQVKNAADGKFGRYDFVV